MFDANKTYGQVVTFQSPKDFKKEIDRALRLYSRGGEGVAVSEDWESVLDVFSIDVKTIHALGRTPEEIRQLSREQKKSFIYAFRSLDKSFAHLKAFPDIGKNCLQTMISRRRNMKTMRQCIKMLWKS